MVGMVKKCLRKTLYSKKINTDELRTILVEIETRVNNRPLTYVHEAIDEPEALTPNHLLQGSTTDPVPSVINKNFAYDPDYILKQGVPKPEQLRTRFNHITKLLRQWNKVWQNDYLTSLREYHKGGKSSTPTCPLKKGDIVFIDCGSPRSTLPIGKIVSLHPDQNGTVRVVTVSSKSGISRRTVDKLIPLEMPNNNHNDDQTPRENVN